MNRYKDMLDLPRHVSRNRKHMSNADRAAQFSPFSALTGYEELIAETGRLTEERRELSTARQEELNAKLVILSEQKEPVALSVVYFREDPVKDGGSYEVYTGDLRRIDTENGYLIFRDTHRIRLDDLWDIECELFTEAE